MLKVNEFKCILSQVPPPKFGLVQGRQDYMVNAFIEFIAVIETTRKLNTDICESIMQNYLRGTRGLLQIKLKG